MKTIATAVAAAALIAPATGQAATTHATPCRPATPSFVSYLGVSGGVSCATARTVEHYWERHEIRSKTVRIAGKRWTYLKFGSTGTQFTMGAPKVGVPCIEIASRPYG